MLGLEVIRSEITFVNDLEQQLFAYQKSIKSFIYNSLKNSKLLLLAQKITFNKSIFLSLLAKISNNVTEVLEI